MPDLLRFACYLLAVVCFVVSSLRGDALTTTSGRRGFGLLALGLAFAFLPALWDSAEALN